MTVIDATTHPDQANRLIADALAEKPAPAVDPAPAISLPPDGRVTLMAGLVNQLEGTTTTDAVVRELTGADEEILASPTVARSTARFIQAVVGRGTVSIGGEKATGAHYDALLIGDRELLLLAIRKATYGPTVEMVTKCPHCGDVDNDFVYDLNDAPIRELAKLDDAIYGFNVDLPSGKVATVSLPRAVDQDALLTADKKNEGELNTLMLSRCVSKIGGTPVVGDGPLRALTIRDRQALLKEINERTPGPRLGEAKRTCGACEQEFELGLGLLDIFRA